MGTFSVPQILPVDKVLNAADGVVGDIASKMTVLTDSSKQVSDVFKQAENVLGGMNNSGLAGFEFPDLGMLEGKLYEIEGKVIGEVNDRLGTAKDLTGTCLYEAASAINSVIGDAWGYVDNLMNGLYEVSDMPMEMVDLSGKLSKARNKINALGIGNAINDLTSSLGCLGNSSVITSVKDQIDGACDILGLDIGSYATSETVYGDLKTAMAGGTTTLDAIAGKFGLNIDTIATEADFDSAIDTAIQGGVSMLTGIYKDLGVDLDNLCTPEKFTEVMTGGIDVGGLTTVDAMFHLGVTQEDMFTTTNLQNTLMDKVTTGTMDVADIADGLNFNIDLVKTAEDFYSGVSGYVDNVIAMGGTMMDGVKSALSDLSLPDSEMLNVNNLITSAMDKINAGSLIGSFSDLTFDKAQQMAQAQIDKITSAFGMTFDGGVTSDSFKGMIYDTVTKLVPPGSPVPGGDYTAFVNTMTDQLSVITDSADRIYRQVVTSAQAELSNVATIATSAMTKLPESFT